VNLPMPVPAPGQILVRVAAAGVNRADLLQVAGRHPPPAGISDTPGLEISGTVVAGGPGGTAAPFGNGAQSAPGAEHMVGKEVCALLQGGGYAQYTLANMACVLPVPKGVSLRDAGGLPEVYFTVWSNVMDGAKLKPGETFLVHGGTSGIGTAAIQLMHARGHRVFTTAGCDRKCEAARKLGAARAINYRNEDFVAAVKEETGGKGVDVILDMVGGDYVMRNLQSLAVGGRLVNIAYQKGSQVEVDFRLLQARRLTMMASGLRLRPDSDKEAMRDALLEHVWPLIEEGAIRPVVDTVLPLAQARKAHEIMQTSRHIGKILLEP